MDRLKPRTPNERCPHCGAARFLLRDKANNPLPANAYLPALYECIHGHTFMDGDRPGLARAADPLQPAR